MICEMTWQDYETTVSKIYETLGAEKGVTIEGHGARCRRMGKSGSEHQFDVLTKHSDGLHTYRTAIECKWWNDKVDKHPIIKIAYEIRDCNIEKAVVVSKKGFNKDAIACAQESNIDLIELSEHNISIKGNRITKAYMNLMIGQPELISINTIVAAEDLESFAASPLRDAKTDEVFFKEPSGRKFSVASLVNAFLNDKVLHCSNHEPVNDSVVFEKGTKLILIKSGEAFPVIGFKLCGYNCHFTRLDRDCFTNQIWLMMKVLFGGKQYFVNLEGQLMDVNGGNPITATAGRMLSIAAQPRTKQFLMESS